MPLARDGSPPAVVLVPDRERRATALGLVRCLGRAGVRVVALSPRRFNPAFRSRYVSSRVVVPPLESEPEGWLASLAEVAAEQGDRPVLFPSADEHVWLVHQHREALAGLVRYPFLSPESLRGCVDKHDMYERCSAAGIETGQVIHVPDPAQPGGAIEQARFPTVLKPAAWVDLARPRATSGRPFLREFGSKALLVRGRDELRRALAAVARLDLPVVLQEEIPGPAAAIYHVSLYADAESRVRGLFVARKTRQLPSRFGGACLLETETEPEVAALAASAVQALGFRGIAGAVEFKRHAHTGRLHFIELNPRVASSIAGAQASGVNLPLLAYLDAIGAELPDVTVGAEPLRWIDLQRDLLYWWFYRRGDHTGVGLSLRDYLRSLRGRRELAYWAPDDPVPAFAKAATGPRDVAAALIGAAGRRRG